MGLGSCRGVFLSRGVASSGSGYQKTAKADAHNELAKILQWQIRQTHFPLKRRVGSGSKKHEAKWYSCCACGHIIFKRCRQGFGLRCVSRKNVAPHGAVNPTNRPPERRSGELDGRPPQRDVIPGTTSQYAPFSEKHRAGGVALRGSQRGVFQKTRHIAM